MSWIRTERVGDLDVHIAGGGDGRGGGDGPLVVLLHGFGAPGTDLVALQELIDTPRAVRFAFPEAPIAMPGPFSPGRAWWMIDFEQLERDLTARDQARRSGNPWSGLGERAREVPDGLARASEALIGALDALRGLLAVGDAPVVLGGFSQGSMLACEVALRTDQPLAGLALLSSTLIAADRWREAAPARAGLPVFQSHGEADPLLPIEAAGALRDLLREAGLRVSWCPFAGGHEIPAPVLDALSEFLGRCRDGK